MSEAMEKPTKVEVGQRWQYLTSKWTVLGFVDGEPQMQMDGGGGSVVTGSATNLLTMPGWKFLGPFSPSGVPAPGRVMGVRKVDPALGPLPAGCLWCGGELKGAEPFECEACPTGGYRERTMAWQNGARDFPRAPPVTPAVRPEQCIHELAKADCQICGSPSAPAVQRREVSHNGRDWIPYERLTDADPFDSYRHRRVDGVVSVGEYEPSRIYAASCGSHGCRELEEFEGSEYCAKHIGEMTNAANAQRRPALQPLATFSLPGTNPPQSRLYATPTRTR